MAPSVWPALCEMLTEATREEAEVEALGRLAQGQEGWGGRSVYLRGQHTRYIHEAGLMIQSARTPHLMAGLGLWG